MNKMMKKIMAILAVLAMAVTMLPAAGIKAAATIDQSQTGSLTILKTAKVGNTPTKMGVEGAEFSLYQVAQLAPGTDGKYQTWQLLAPYGNKENGLNITADNLGNISTKELESMAEQAKAIALNEKADAAVTTDGNGSAVANKLPIGYYLVVETKTPTNYVASKPFFVAIPSTNNYNTGGEGDEWVYDITVQPKNQGMPEVVKTADKETAGLNEKDIVTYTLTDLMFPTYDEGYANTRVTYVITDQLSSGLDLVTSEDGTPLVNIFSVTTGEDGEDVKAALESGMELTYADRKLTITFDEKTIRENAGKSIEVTYQAKLNENAVVGNPGNINEVSVEYTNNPNGQVNTTTDDEVVYSFALQVTKTGENNEKLKDVEFELYTDEECTTQYREETYKTGEEGVLTVERLAAGTYYLKETKTAKGYTLLTSPVKIEITKDANATGEGVMTYTYKVDNAADAAAIGENGIIPVSVVNQKGFNLPETGGMGTYLFTIGGIVIMVGAVFALLAMKKKSK